MHPTRSFSGDSNTLAGQVVLLNLYGWQRFSCVFLVAHNRAPSLKKSSFLGEQATVHSVAFFKYAREVQMGYVRIPDVLMSLLQNVKKMKRVQFAD